MKTLYEQKANIKIMCCECNKLVDWAYHIGADVFCSKKCVIKSGLIGLCKEFADDLYKDEDVMEIQRGLLE